MQHLLEQFLDHGREKEGAIRHTNISLSAIVSSQSSDLASRFDPGKSTLLNTLARSDVVARDVLFATLDPTTRRVNLPSGREVVTPPFPPTHTIVPEHDWTFLLSQYQSLRVQFMGSGSKRGFPLTLSPHTEPMSHNCLLFMRLFMSERASVLAACLSACLKTFIFKRDVKITAKQSRLEQNSSYLIRIDIEFQKAKGTDPLRPKFHLNRVHLKRFDCTYLLSNYYYYLLYATI
jgi:hypothetical protein